MTVCARYCIFVSIDWSDFAGTLFLLHVEESEQKPCGWLYDFCMSSVAFRVNSFIFRSASNLHQLF